MARPAKLAGDVLSSRQIYPDTLATFLVNKSPLRGLKLAEVRIWGSWEAIPRACMWQASGAIISWGAVERVVVRHLVALGVLASVLS